MSGDFGEGVPGGGEATQGETLEAITDIARFSKLRLIKRLADGAEEVVPGELFYLPQQPIKTGGKMVLGKTEGSDEYRYFQSSQVKGITRLDSKRYRIITKSGSVYELEVLSEEHKF